MKSNPKQISSGAYNRISLIKQVYTGASNERPMGIRLAPLTLNTSKNLANIKPIPEKIDRMPIVSNQLPPPKISGSQNIIKHNTLIPAGKFPAPLDRQKLIKKNFLDTSLDSALEERDLSHVSKLLFKGSLTKPRAHILAPITHEKSNLIKPGEKAIIKKRIRSVVARPHEYSFISEKSRDHGQKTEIVPPLNLNQSGVKDYIKVNINLNTSVLTNTDRTHAKGTEFTPTMSRKGSEPGQFSSDERLHFRRLRGLQKRMFDDPNQSPPTNHKFKKPVTFISEIEKSLSVDSNRENENIGNHQKKNQKSNVSLADAGKPTLDPNKRFNTSFSIGISLMNLLKEQMMLMTNQTNQQIVTKMLVMIYSKSRRV